MNALLTTLGLCALVATAACARSDDPDPAAAMASPDTAAAADLIDPAPDDTVRAMPPGLAPVMEDDPHRLTADRPTSGPAASTPQTGRPAADPPVTAQPPAEQASAQDEGTQILRRAAAAYENVRSMQAAFVMQFHNPLLRQQTTSRGMLYQQRPDRIALRFTDPDGDIILSDGENFYIYQPSIDAKQATQTPASAGGGGGVDLQAQFVGNPTERFRYTLEGRETVGNRPADIMMLVPRERAEYRSLKVWFDTRDSLARRFEITEHNGSVRRFDLSGLRINEPVAADVFRFSAPAGVRIVRVG